MHPGRGLLQGEKSGVKHALEVTDRALSLQKGSEKQI